MRCIEIVGFCFPHRVLFRLIETWDVLKLYSAPQASLSAAINRNMRCIEILIKHFRKGFDIRLIETWDVLKYVACEGLNWFMSGINRNMRCIEIPGNVSFEFWNRRLIETWDVLKFLFIRDRRRHLLINRNMRCIEIHLRFRPRAVRGD